MTDGIDGIAGANGAMAPKKAPAQAKVEKVATPESRRNGTDVVNLTETAEAISSLSSNVGDTAPVDRQKVDAIKSALAAGEYKMDADKVAQKFIEIEQALGKL